MVDADTKLHPALGRETRVPHLKCALELDSTLDGIDETGKLGEALSPASLRNGTQCCSIRL